MCKGLRETEGRTSHAGFVGRGRDPNLYEVLGRVNFPKVWSFLD